MEATVTVQQAKGHTKLEMYHGAVRKPCAKLTQPDGRLAHGMVPNTPWRTLPCPWFS